MLYTAVAIIVLDWIGFGILLPTFPFFAESYGANGLIWGSLLSVYAFMQFLFAPQWGRLSDRIGRRPVLIMTIFGGALGLLILAWAQSLTWMFIGRMISGVCAANMSVATAYISDVTDEQDRTMAMGMAGAAVGIGFVLGPAIGALLVPYGFQLPIYVAAGLYLLNGLQVMVRLREPEQHQVQERVSLRVSLRDPLLRRLVVINFFLVMGITQLEATVPLYLEHVYHLVPQQVGYCLVMIAVVMVMVQGGLVRRLRVVPERLLVVAGAGILAASLALLPLGWPMRFMMVLLAIGAVGRGLAQPALLSIASKTAQPGQQGQVMGIFHSAASLARCAPFIAGALYDWNTGAPFFVGGAMILIVAALAIRLHRAG